MTCSSAPVFEWSPRPLHLVAAEHSCYQYLEGERLLDGRVLLVTDGYTVVHCLHCTFQCSLYQEFLSDGSLVPLSHALQNPGFSPGLLSLPELPVLSPVVSEEGKGMQWLLAHPHPIFTAILYYEFFL